MAMASEPARNRKSLTLRLEGDPTPEQALKAGQHLLSLVREIEREMRRQGAIPADAPPIKWRLSIRTDGGDGDGD